MVMTDGEIHRGKRPSDVLAHEAVCEAQFLRLDGLLRPQSPDLDSLFNPDANEMLLGTLGDARLRLSAPIRVKMDVEGSQYVAEATEFSEFGFGASRSEAIRDLQRALVELYFTLDQEQDHLGSDLAKVWESLKSQVTTTKK